jgi:hypothetical protein
MDVLFCQNILLLKYLTLILILLLCEEPIYTNSRDDTSAQSSDGALIIIEGDALTLEILNVLFII